SVGPRPAGRPSSAPRTGDTLMSRTSFRPQVESLEDRLALSTSPLQANAQPPLSEQTEIANALAALQGSYGLSLSDAAALARLLSGDLPGPHGVGPGPP